MSIRKMITLGQPERRLETIFGFYQFWPVLTGFDRFWPVLRQCYSKLQSRCVKLSVMLSLADSKIVSSEFPFTTPGNSATHSLTQRVLISWGSFTQPQHSNEQPDSQLEPPWLCLTAAVVCHSQGISFDPEPGNLNYQSVRVTLL